LQTGLASQSPKGTNKEGFFELVLRREEGRGKYCNESKAMGY
jgi:hypothetical protein